jgi:hypothetical protein
MFKIEDRLTQSAKELRQRTLLGEAVRRPLRAIRAKLADRYEPSRHYMRGVGPKTLAGQTKIDSPSS